MARTLKGLIREHNVRLDLSENGVPYNEDFSDGYGYMATLKLRRRQITTPFYTGRGWTREPEAYDVLDSLLSDASCADYARDFEDFCNDLGYDPDSRKAEKIFKACQRTSRKLRRFLGEHYNTFMESER